MIRPETSQETAPTCEGNRGLKRAFSLYRSPLHIDVSGAKWIPLIFIQYLLLKINQNLTFLGAVNPYSVVVTVANRERPFLWTCTPDTNFIALIRVNRFSLEEVFVIPAT